MSQRPESENCGMLHKLDQWFCVKKKNKNKILDNGVLKQKYRHICRPDMTCQCENHFEKYIDLRVCVQYRPSVLKSSLIFLKRRKQNFTWYAKNHNMNNIIMQGVFKRFKPELNKSYDIVIENDYFIVNGESLNNRQFHSWLKNILLISPLKI